MKKKIISILLTIFMIIGIIPFSAVSVFAEESGQPHVAFYFYDEDANAFHKSVHVGSYTTVESTTTTWSAGWYIADGTVEIGSGVTLTGDVKLILKDGCKLTVNGGINVGHKNLTVYGQYNGTGELIANGDWQCAGIGGSGSQDFGSITIYGGRVNATGGGEGAGIGSGYNGSGGTVNIYGGTVTAYGGNLAAGIGGGDHGKCTVNIYGGTVTATGGGSGAGIGGGDESDGNVNIYGGTVIANGGERNGAGIGGGSSGSGGTITINGGTVEAVNTATTTYSGIGSGEKAYGGDITINGGTVTASGIGPGNEGIGGTVIINGGDVASNGISRAGIGGGYSTNGIDVTINGGTVKAKGGSGCAGIGGGSSGNGGTFIINGGNVTATGGSGAAGIGAGKDGSCGGTVTITDGVVKAYGSLGSAAIGEGTSDTAVDIYGGDITADSQSNADAVVADSVKVHPDKCEVFNVQDLSYNELSGSPVTEEKSIADILSGHNRIHIKSEYVHTFTNEYVNNEDGTHTWENGVCTVCGYDNTFVIDENGVLVGYNGKGGDIVIPDGVTGINDCAFSEREDITSVTIPDSVKSIDAGAFEDCTNLISVTLPNGLKAIENETFMNCINLKNVTIPDSVESIGDSAFGNCTGLKNVIIPNSVKSIGVCAFNYCKGIESITISDNVTEIKAHAFWYCENLEDVYVFCDSNIYAVKKLMQSFGDYTYIQLDHEFTDNKCRVCGIMEFDIIDGVLYGYYGKGGDVVIPDGVTGIKGAFSNCSSVTSVTIPNSVTSIGAKSFENCVSLTSVVIPCSVKSIGDYAFESCVSLSSITISGNIDIGDSIFDDCGSLVNVYCNCDSDIESVKAFMEDFGRNMFTYTQLDHEFTDNKCRVCGIMEFNIIDGVLVRYNGNGGDVVIPDGVTSIGSSAFAYCSGLKNVTIPDSLKIIKNNAFTGCTNLMSVRIPNSVISIGNHAFYCCTNLTSVTISDKVSSMGDFVFLQCENIRDVYIPCDSNADTVKGIMQSYGDFKYTNLDHHFVNGVCTACGLDEFVIEDGVLVGYNGKGGDIVIPDEVTEIDRDVFSFNQTITSVKMPNVTKVGKNAFADCYKLTSVDMPQVESLDSGVFNGCFELASADLPNATSIGESAFKNSSLKSIDISKVEDICNHAFWDCDGLTSVTMNSSVELGSFVFDGCDKLKTVYCTCDSDINVLKGKMSEYGDFTYTQLDHNFADGVCTACGERNKISGISVKNGAQLTDDGEMIYGLDCGLNSAEDYFDITDNTLSLSYNKDIIGTGAHINIERDGKIIAYYVAVIFGDVNGDGWYDGTDSIIVNCLANGMLTKEQVGKAVYMAADCNHDGVIDSLDVDILNQAGVLLADVDQSKSEEELLETSSAYVEYLNLIDQTVEAETIEAVEEPVDPGYTFNFFDMILNLIKEIITVIKSAIEFFK